jgi:hypothetical protein
LNSRPVLKRICGRHTGRHCESSLYEYSALFLLYKLASSPNLVIVYHRRYVTSATDSTVRLTLKIRNCANSLLIFCISLVFD